MPKSPGEKRRRFNARERKRQAWHKIREYEIWCCGCGRKVTARLTDGKEIYPHRPDLHDLPFWRCDGCKNYVGTHHKLASRVQPLGNIPTPELRAARQQIHKILDPLWMCNGHKTRDAIYIRISQELGYQYHTSWIKTMDEARLVYKIVSNIAKGR